MKGRGVLLTVQGTCEPFQVGCLNTGAPKEGWCAPAEQGKESQQPGLVGDMVSKGAARHEDSGPPFLSLGTRV